MADQTCKNIRVPTSVRVTPLENESSGELCAVDKLRTTTTADNAIEGPAGHGQLIPGRHPGNLKTDLKLPDFAIIGAARCGTTTLYEHLQRHPDVFMCTPKEPGFFALDQEYAKGFDYYASLFQDAAVGQIRGEASTYYTSFPCTEVAARRLHDANPDAKLIYILRHPVDRLYSHYIQETKACLWLNAEARDIGEIPRDADGCYLMPQEHQRPWRIAPDFEQSLEICPEFLLHTSHYIDTIRIYLQYFPREALLILLLEDLAQDPDGTMAQVFEFLGLPRIKSPDRIVANAADADAPGEYWRSRFKVWLGKRSGISQETINHIAWSLPKRFRRSIADTLLKVIIRDKEQPELASLPKKIDPALRARLLEQFRDSNEELAQFLGRDLSHWNC
jgi:hypothetical protein